ncbi:MAG: flagellar basal body-associated FliL family protein [Sulfuricella sp.]|nr:flagellar basal body-associated FliL family protein [Sulfuricella sp.]
MAYSKIKTASVLFLIFTGFLFSTGAAHASESAGKEGGMYAKLEPFTVNLLGLSQYLQVAVTLKLAKPEAEEAVKANMPIIRHEFILLLSSKEASQISSFEGKQKLMEEAKQAVNKVLKSTEKEGVASTLFESFIIQ